MSEPPRSASGRTPSDGGLGHGKAIDPVDAEWAKIEEERVAEEVAEARDDAIEAIVDPVDRRRGWGWMWWAFAAALVSGAVFAGWVDLVVAMNRPAPEPPPPPVAKTSPSPSERGPGTGEDDADDPDVTPETAPTDATEPEKTPLP